jgi:putative Ca2+/H+ antiporter (TMEM165/GDT1 family)
LLTAIGTTLGVLTSRLNRIVDRSRIREGHIASSFAKEEGEIRTELSTLSRRSKLINIAITLGTICALLICSMIAAMFVGVFLSIDLTNAVAVLF